MASKKAKKLPVTPASPGADLGPAGADLWRKLRAEYRIDDAHGESVLLLACRALDRAEACRKAIDKAGVELVDRFGQHKPHPLLAAERDARAAVLVALRQLALPIPQETKDHA